ncbi:MAG: hypothetical protein R3Y64_11380, partial [Peptostreptococcaceae bacterium]
HSLRSFPCLICSVNDVAFIKTKNLLCSHLYLTMVNTEKQRLNDKYKGPSKDKEQRTKSIKQRLNDKDRSLIKSIKQRLNDKDKSLIKSIKQRLNDKDKSLIKSK